MMQRLDKAKILGGHRPKNDPKMPHFWVKIGKMRHFCLILEILGGGTCPPGPPSYLGAVQSIICLKAISGMKEAPWIFAHYIKKSTNFT